MATSPLPDIDSPRPIERQQPQAKENQPYDQDVKGSDNQHFALPF
jgi:hypothetical protein